EIAVKKLYDKHIGLEDDKQFMNECTNLMGLQHRNIVRLVGYCYEIAHKVVEYNGQYVYAAVEKRALCFEYLRGGSLDKYLSNKSCGLGWHTCYKIIKGICEGLHYLHNGTKDPIYHLDLKPANILLDENMVPKIGDFGLSRLFDSTQTHTTKGIIGTFGYMPPEYVDRYQITPKFDVFSLGVIIIKLMAGHDGYLKFENMSRQEFIDLVHGNWEKRLQLTMSSRTSHEIKTCIEIALRCVELDRVKRPTIAEIIDEMNKIDNAKRLLGENQDNLHNTQAKQYTSSGAAYAEGALIVDRLRDNDKVKEHRTLEQKVLDEDPPDTQRTQDPGPQSSGLFQRFLSMWDVAKPALKTKSEGQNGLLWWHDLARCQDGDFSIAVVQANQLLEDQCLVESSRYLGTVVGVFDGHGGPEAACFIRDHLLSNLQAASGPQGMTTHAIREAFLAVEKGFITLVSHQWETKPMLSTVGSCCLVGVVHRRTLFIANLGDSRAVLGRSVHATGEVLAMQLSEEHNVRLEKVRNELRLEHPDDPDIVVLVHNIWRVRGMIQVSRSIGDAYLKHPQYNKEPLHAKFRLRKPFSKPLLSANPSIVSHSIEPRDHFVIFASDGLWEHLSNQEAVDIVQNHQREGSAKRLIKAALQEAAKKREMRYSHLIKIDKGVRRHFHDDITVVVLFFNHAIQPPALSIRCPLR
ncbi:unnamed protein product, partial [Urochloa humidicola]